MINTAFPRKHARILIFLSFLCFCYFFSDQLYNGSAQALARIPALDRFTNALPGKHKLVPFALEPLPLSSIKPSGWLQDQMQLMADGLAGHEYDFYDYVKHSSWLGGDKEYSALNEGFPYWFNGLVPLAYGLEDARLKEQVHSAAQYVLDNQAHDGWLGPEIDSDRLLWARFPLCLGLIQLAEANGTWLSPVLDSLHKFSQLLNAMLKDDGVGYVMQKTGDWRFHIFTWGRVRNADMIITLQWLYEHHPADRSAMLLENMKYLHNYGLKWENWYSKDSYFGRGMHEDLYTLPENDTLPYFHYQHGVNVAQGLKSPAVVQRFTHNNSLTQTAKDGVHWSLTYHGSPSGTIIGDERIVGLSPHSGSELCTSVELMYSLAYLYLTTGDSYYADRAETAAFNSLPAMFTPDYWAHQYMQASNQASAKNYTASPFYNTNSWSQTYGLEPHYPCCTVNHPQGWPKFLSHSFAKVGETGIAHTLLSPGIVRTTLASGGITVEAKTAYPFTDVIEYVVTAEGPADLHVRVPSWARHDSSITIESSSSMPLRPDPSNGLHKVSLAAGVTKVSYVLQSRIRTETRANDTISVFKGALLYALEIEYTRSSTMPKTFRSPYPFYEADSVPAKVKDWEYKHAAAWNIAIDPWTFRYILPSFVQPDEISNPVFASEGNFGFIAARGCEIDWPALEDGLPGDPPVASQRQCIGESFDVKLIPYGAAKLHIAEIPTIELEVNR